MNKKQISYLMAALALYIVFIAPVFFHSPDQLKAFILLVIMQILWLGRVFSLAFGSLLMMLILSFHFMSYEKVLSFLASPVVWLLFSTYLLSGAFIRSGIAHRIALKILALSKGSGQKIMGASFLLISVLAFVIPSNIGRANLVTSILDKTMANVSATGKVERLPKALFIAICYLTALTGALIATGASSTIYTFGFINEHVDHPLNFLQWMLFMVPPVAVMIVILIVLLSLLFPFEKVDREQLAAFISGELEKTGRVKRSEIKMLIIITLTVLLWVTEPWHHFSVPLIGLLGAAATVFPYCGVWTWDEAKKKVNWDMIIFFASTLMLSDVLITSGLMKTLSAYMLSVFSGAGIIPMLIVFIILIFVMRIFFVNVLGIMTFILPLSFTVGEQLDGAPPLLFPLAFFLAGVPGFFFITQSPVHIISFSYGYFTEKELMKTGVLAAFIWLAVIIATALFYWRPILM